MISEKIQNAFNEQLNAELYSSYLYLSMSAHFDSNDLPGFANWLRVQAKEELFHAMKFYDYLIERDGRVVLQQIEGPATEWESPQAAFENVKSHEEKVTGLINNLMEMAIEEKDFASTNFLQWYVDEQVEEEASSNEVLNKIKLIGKDGSGLFLLDQELGKRIYTLPATETKISE